MTQVPTPDNVIAPFSGVQVDAVRGQPMLLERRGDDFWAQFDDPDFRGRHGETRRISRKVVLMTGSHQQQVYWYATGLHRLISKLPAIYLIREKQWIPRRAAFLHPPDEPAGSETGGWNGICIACHTTNGKPEIDTPFGSQPVLRQVVESTVSEFGIACEACHGPAEEHTRVNRNPARRYWLHLTAKEDTTIAHPLRVDPRRSSQICGQCHSIWEFYDVAAERQANSHGLPYRPGAELRDTRFMVQPTTNLNSQTMREILAEDPSFLSDSFWSDGMVRVSGREYNGLIESPCFKDAHDAKRTLSCFSCHAEHEGAGDPRSVQNWADGHQLAAGMDGNEACLQCHSKFRTNLQDHTRHHSASANLCYNCHMPYTSYGLLRALRSHQVSSPSVAASVSTGRPNACNQCHLDRTLAWTSEYLAKWYAIPKPELTAEQQTISAAILWLLRGDAGQRALMAWSAGWQPARQASGVDWMAPFVGQLLDDPYDAVRFIAARSLATLPGFENFNYNFLASPNVRAEAVSNVVSAWRGAHRADPQLLLGAGGAVDFDMLKALKTKRDDRRMFMRE
ncbi:MAG TPA: ammonia-forming cytochrome c nitrite reductase subunit c552 [Bryobacteraceae bacterium]|nr:ammonia-forming cytochrome c nitrite reductase subunit c552 [Bryobacteraceae bacterium]